MKVVPHRSPLKKVKKSHGGIRKKGTTKKLNRKVLEDITNTILKQENDESPQSKNNNLLDYDNYDDFETSIELLKESETKHLPNASYTSQHSLHFFSMREELVDWLIEVCEEFHLCSATLHLCINILDRYLSNFPVSPSKLQEVGITCLYIASKYQEIDPPSLKKCVAITDYSCSGPSILKRESHILNTLEFNLTVTTHLDFLCHFKKKYKLQDRILKMAAFFSDLCLQKFEMLRFVPSVIATSCIVMSLRSLSLPYWNEEIEEMSGYTFDQIFDCLNELCCACNKYLLQSKLTAIQHKHAKMLHGVILFKCDSQQ